MQRREPTLQHYPGEREGTRRRSPWLASRPRAAASLIPAWGPCHSRGRHAVDSVTRVSATVIESNHCTSDIQEANR